MTGMIDPSDLVAAQMESLVKGANRLLANALIPVTIYRAETTAAADCIRIYYLVEALPADRFSSDILKSLACPPALASVAAYVARYHLQQALNEGDTSPNVPFAWADEGEPQDEDEDSLDSMTPVGRA